MTSETDSSNSSLSQFGGKRKSKKIKTKLERKHKKEKSRKSQKEKKRLHKNVRNKSAAGVLQTELLKKGKQSVMSQINDVCGPALPPHFLNKNESFEKSKSVAVGPVVPIELLEHFKNSESQIMSENCLDKISESKGECESNDDNFQDFYGPLPLSSEAEMTQSHLELEQRALELKMSALDGISAPTINQNVREEWMLELPNIQLKSGLAALNNLKRGFHQGKEKPDFSDRSCWTKTPNSVQEDQKPASSKILELRAQTLYKERRDAEQETIANNYRKKHKREKSLVEIHQKKLRKEKKKKFKELKESLTKPERRPFQRDYDLKLNKIDRNQTKQIVDKAKILNTKFSSGESKYL